MKNIRRNKGPKPNLNRKPRPFETLFQDEKTGFLHWSSEMVKDFYGLLVHKNNVQQPTPFEYTTPNTYEPTPRMANIGEGEYESRETALPGKYFIDVRKGITYVWFSTDYLGQRWIEATPAQQAAFVPQISSQIFNYLVNIGVETSTIGPVTSFDPAGQGVVYSIDTPTNLFTISPTTGNLYSINPQLVIPNQVYEIVVRVTSNMPGAPYATATMIINTFYESRDPVITTPSTVNVEENTLYITDLTSFHPDGLPITMSISGGADQSNFYLDGLSLYFFTPKDYEDPQDADTNNIYEVEIKAIDSATNVATKTIGVNITNVFDTVPIISSGGEYEIKEDDTFVATLSATDPEGGSIIWSIGGGADAALFTIGSSSGDLEFKDESVEGEYEVSVRATSSTSSLFAVLNVTVTVIGGFNPGDFGTIMAYWNANADPSTITVTGLGVSQWLDSSGNGHTLVQTTDADRPSFSSTAGVRNMPGVIFERASTEFLISNEAASTWTSLHDDNGHTIVLVMEQQQLPSSNQHGGILGTVGSSFSGQGIFIKFFRTAANIKQYNCGNNGTTDQTPVSYTDTFTNSRSMVLSVAWQKDGAITDDAIIYLNGSSVATGNITRTVSASNPGNTLNIGTLGSDTSSRNNNMIIHAIIIYNSKLDASTQLALYNAIVEEWGAGGTT